MTIKNKLELGTVFVLFTALLIGLALFGTIVEVNKANENNKRSAQLVEEIMELQTLTVEYLQQPMESTELAWQSHYNSLDTWFALDLGNQQSRILLENIQKNYEDISFEDLQNGNAQNSLFIVKLNMMLSQSIQLRDLVQSQLENITTQSTIFFLASIGLVVAMIAGASVLIKKNVVQPLLKLHTQNQAILRSIGDAMVVIDAEGTIIFVNKAFEDLFGWKLKEVNGKNVFDQFSIYTKNKRPLKLNKNPLYLTLSGRKKIINTAEYYYAKKDKTLFPGAVTVSPMRMKEIINGAILLVRDITREKELATMKNKFLTFAADQLRTPLGNMRWNLEMLLEDNKKKKPLPKETKQTLEQMYESNQKIIELVNELLDVSLIKNGDLEKKIHTLLS